MTLESNGLPLAGARPLGGPVLQNDIYANIWEFSIETPRKALQCDCDLW
jgi:hypothetical protein